jgi:hypothetical protein
VSFRNLSLYEGRCGSLARRINFAAAARVSSLPQLRYSVGQF